jgi:hypothetical protein
LTMTIVMRNSSLFHIRKRTCVENGFIMERKDV